MNQPLRVKHLILSNLALLALIVSALMVYRVAAEPAAAEPGRGAASPSLSMDVLAYQGTLVDAGGAPVNGSIGVTFRLYDHPTAEGALWAEAHTGANALPVQSGLFNVTLGSLNPIPDSVWQVDALYLGVQIEGETEMTPREAVHLLPPRIVENSLDSSVLKRRSMVHGLFNSYQFNYGSALRFVNYVTGAVTELDPNSCAVNDTWCCNAEDTICLRRNGSGEDELALRLADSHGSACWLVHHDDDQAASSTEIAYAVDGDGTNSPFPDEGNVFYFMRPGANDIPVARWAQYLILCLQ
jgi:hypothetical protein